MAENLVYKPEYGNCWAYENDEHNVSKFGYLYDWETAIISCPKGWRLPTKSEFEILLNFTKLKYFSDYKALMLNGKSGFSVIFSGYRSIANNFKGASNGCSCFWGNTEHDKDNAVRLNINYKEETHIYFYDKKQGFSVRCIKNIQK